MSTRLIRLVALPALVAGVILFSFGCAQTTSREDSATSVAAGHSSDTTSLEMAREAARVVLAIEKEPARLAEILAAHSMTLETYEELLYKIARDPDLTEAYEAARTGSSY